MRIALLSTDNREDRKHYKAEYPMIPTPQAALLQGLEKYPDCEAHFVSCLQEPVNAPKKLADNVWYHALHVPKTGWMRTGYQGCIRAVRRKLREIAPDIVHGQGTERDCAISAVFSGYPNVITIHGKMTEIADLNHARIGNFYWCAALLENFTLPRTNGIICISSYVENSVKRYGAPLWVIPNALQRPFFDFPRTFTERELPVLINVGVISERKRQRQILQTLRELRSAGLDFETIFIGRSDLDSPYAIRFQEELAAAHAALGKFSHIPGLTAEELCQLFDTSSALIHFAEQETFGLVFGEALARNLHLFASDVGSIRDISKGIHGVEIFHLDNWIDLKSALHRWLLTNTFKTPKPDTSPQELVDRYHPVAVARRHLEVYREVIDRAGKAAPTGR